MTQKWPAVEAMSSPPKNRGGRRSPPAQQAGFLNQLSKLGSRTGMMGYILLLLLLLQLLLLLLLT